LIALAALLLAATLSGCFLLPEETQAPELPLVTPFAGAEYSTVAVSRGDILLEARVSFTFSPTRREELRFSVPDRRYGAVYVSQGDEVQKGQLLAELDTQAEKAALEATEAELTRLNIRLESARTALEIALEEEALQGGFSTVSSDARRADVEYCLSAIAIREKQREEQRAALESLRLYAPMDGTVTYAKNVSENSRSGRSDTVVTVTDSGSAVFTARTGDWALFPEGETVVVTAQETEYLCVVRDPALFGLNAELLPGDQKNVCLELLDEEAPADAVRGEVRIPLDRRENVLLLPERAVFTVGEKSYVYFEDASGLKSALEIQCGLTDGSSIEIVSGLEEGDHVIVG
jgi:macrolide-specific efflux system membrane fusion protein